jgi:hypothetical protein
LKCAIVVATVRDNSGSKASTTTINSRFSYPWKKPASKSKMARQQYRQKIGPDKGPKVGCHERVLGVPPRNREVERMACVGWNRESNQQLKSQA